MKKTIAMLLVLVMLVCGLAACGEETGTTASAVTTEKTAKEEETTEAGYVLPVEDFATSGEPAEYNMMVRAGRYSYLYVESEDNSGKVERAVYSRNSGIEEEYGIVFSIDQASDAESGTYFKSRLETGEPTWDLVVMDYWWGLENQGFFVNLLNCDDIDFSSDWWYSGWNDNTRLNGRSYTIVGDASLELLQNIEIVYFNKTIANAHDYDLYSLVDNGQWTLGKMAEYSKEVAQLDDEDATKHVYGALYDLHSMRAQLFSAGLKLTTVSANGIIDIVADDESNVNICDKVTSLIHTTGVDYVDSNARQRDYTVFTDGRALFYSTCLYIGEQLREKTLDFEYGIILQPKMDDNEGTTYDYISTNYGASVFCIPVSADNTHMSAMVLNAMNYYSEDTVVDAYYNIILKSRLAKDDKDAAMIDMARDLVYIDFAFIYGDLGLTTAYYDAVTKNTSVSTELASVIESAETNLLDLIASYQ